ncbi:SusC/RagA family TonB-linked outer membrane protein [Rapidithrix thailandica]|uniref:SusC/RagA family TonB-linked outer membrane protein n=1 Tax=Rapidithrix thailandica TaxID=413964 RepID=A0AAW9S5N6_9BACT
MKLKLIRQVLAMSRYALLGLTIQCFLCSMLIAAEGKAQKSIEDIYVSVQIKNQSIEKIFTDIEKQTNFNFAYSKNVLKNLNKLSLSKRHISLANLLRLLSTDHPLDFKRVNGNIYVSRKRVNSETFADAVKKAEDIQISGTVVDEDGQPLPGVSILIKGTTRGASSNVDGSFNLTMPEGATLIFSFIGYKTQEIEVNGQQKLNIVMQSDVSELEEVVVVGFGEQKKLSVVGSVTTVKPKSLKNPSSSLSQSFAGRLSGVVAVQSSGEPGRDAAQFWIRGVATLGNTSPLVFLDGIEISLSDMNRIDPTNIDNFSILKDASATAVYGARGANGVILIETKRGFEGKPRVSFRVENSFVSPTKLPKFTDAVTFMQMYNEAKRNRDPFLNPKYSEEKIDGTRKGLDPYVFPNVDWLDELFKNYATRQYANVNVRGGGKVAKYYMSVSYYRDEGILTKTNVNDFNNNIINERYNFVNNISAKVSPTTELELNISADIVDYNGPAVDASSIFNSVMNSNPVRFPITYPTPDASGHIYFGFRTSGFSNNNPYADLVKGYKERMSSTLISTVRLKQDLGMLTEGLSFNGLASFKNWAQTQTTRTYDPFLYEMTSYSLNEETGKYEYDLELVGNGGRETLAQEASNNGDRFMFFQTSLNYARAFGKHDVTGLLVYLQRQYNINLVTENLTASLPSRNQGISGRFTYSYDDRYLAELNFGYTGSENFIEGKRFGFFPSVAVGYVVSNEAFFEGAKDIFSLLKLRASYGLSGNDRIGGDRFPYVSKVNLSNGDYNYTFGKNFDNTRNGVFIERYENSEITWEEGKKLNLGIDIELFHKLMLNADVFKEVRSGIFLQRNTVPGTMGIGESNPYANIGEVENKGMDITLTYNHSFGKDLIISSRGTFTFAKNKVLKDSNPDRLYPYLSSVGRPVNQLWGLQAERLFIDQEEIENHARQSFISNYYPGDIKYTDVSNDFDGMNQIDANDRVPMGHPTVPEITYGFGVNVIYKKFDLGVLFQGIARKSFFINNIQPFAQNERNVLQAIADDYWTQENQNLYAFYPRLTDVDNPNNTQNSSWWLRDGSFVRLKNAEIGYQMNEKVRFYTNGVNLLTFSKFDLWDPEMGGGNGLGYPPQRTINLGVQVNL